MKLAFLGNFSVDYSSESHYKKTLEAMGHEVIALQEQVTPTGDILFAAQDSDVFIWVHTHGWEQPITGGLTMSQVLLALRNGGIPSVGYHLDLYMAIDRWNQYKDSVYFTELDHFFTVEPQLADWLNANSKVKGHYIHAGVFGQECYIDHGPFQRRNQVLFVGSRGYHPEWPYRPQLIDWLRSTYGDDFTHVGGDGDTGTVRGAPLNNILSHSKVTVGDSLSINFDYPGYWSDRVYETLGRGGFMIHPYIEGMEKDFTDHKHLVFYEFGNFRDLKDKIDYYLYVEHHAEREAIRLAGHEHVKANHTYANRWATILAEVTK